MLQITKVCNIIECIMVSLKYKFDRISYTDTIFLNKFSALVL